MKDQHIRHGSGKYLIYMVAIDHDTSTVLNSSYADYAIKSWSAWCARNDVDFYIRREHNPSFGRPIWNKELVYQYGSGYEKIGVVDSDTMIRGDAPNIFELFDDEFCGVNDLADLNWLFGSLDAYQKFFPDVVLDPMTYVNAGVLFFHGQYLPVFKHILDLYTEHQEELDNWTHGGGREQTILNYTLVQHGIKKRLLQPEWNLLSIHRRDMFRHNWQLDINPFPYFVKYAYVWHFTGFPPEHRENLMRQTWEQYNGLQ
jgi:hypothetical protein